MSKNAMRGGAEVSGLAIAHGVSRRGLIGVAAMITASASIPSVFAKPAKLPALATRAGSTVVRGKTVAWHAQTGEVALPTGASHVEATIFSVAYLADGREPTTRPVTFVWNGGPGSATWHLREDLSPRITEATSTAPKYGFIDNTHSIIDATDLVFIDAPGIGFSRIVEKSAKPRYHGIEEDGRAFCDFIADWLKRNGRLSSPVYLMGESYGGTRAGQVAHGLAERKIAIAGAVLISPSTEGEKPTGDEASLPPQAATAWFHKRGAHTGRTLEQLSADVEAFAKGPYAAALASKDSLPIQQRRAIAERVAGYTGISADFVLSNGLKVPDGKFLDMVLGDKGLRVSEYDGRETRPIPKPGVIESPVDPDGAFDRTASIEALIRRDLGYPAVGAYTRDPAATDPWNKKLTRSADVGKIFADIARSNNKFRVLLVAGYFDTVVPYPQPLANLSANLASDIFQYRIYPAGHGVYGDLPLRAKTTNELARWYANETITG